MEGKTNQELYDKLIEVANIMLAKTDLVRKQTDALPSNFEYMETLLIAQNLKIDELNKRILTIEMLVKQ